MIAQGSDGEQEIGWEEPAAVVRVGAALRRQRPRTSKPKPRATVQNEGEPGGDW